MLKRSSKVVMALVAGPCVVLFFLRGTLSSWYSSGHWRWPRSVDGVLFEYGPRVESKYRGAAEHAGLEWPPDRLTLLAFKSERRMEVWVEDAEVRHRLATLVVSGLSGDLGPKRREGDLQVPEGVYRLTALNPQSTFHLSVRVDYPNREDQAQLRGDLGGDIYVHGGSASIGCLAMGDESIEEIFALAALARQRRILIAPVDLRERPLPAQLEHLEPWLVARYRRLENELSKYRPVD